MQFGETLRKAREAKGLTPSQVAEETHLLVQIVQDMENEDFHRIVAAVYGRGFVRLFAECVGLDPRPLIVEFNNLYKAQSEDAPHPHTETPASAAKPAPQAAPEPAPPAFEFGTPAGAPADDDGSMQTDLPPAPPEGTTGLDLFDPSSRPADPPPRARRADASRFAPPPDEDEYEDDGESIQEKLSAAAKKFRDGLSALTANVSRRTKRIPRKTKRIALIAAIAAIVCVLAIRACVSVKSALSSKPDPAAKPAAGTAAAGGAYGRAGAPPAAPARKPSRPTDLYKD